MNSKILVTGATGTIGSFVVEQLQERGASFVALARNEEKAEALRGKGISAVIGDFADVASLHHALEGVDKVFLLSVTSPEIPRLQGNVVDAAKEKGIRHIVKISAQGANLNSNIGIARFHAEAEAYIRKSGVPFTFLQPQSFMQNLIFDKETIREQGQIFGQVGEGRIAMVDARDIAAVAVEALLNEGHEGKTYVLTGPEAISYTDIAQVFTRALNRQITYIPVTSVQSRSSMLEAGMPGWLVEDLVAVNLQHAAGMAATVSPDVEKVTGRKALTVDDFVRDFIHLFQR